MSLEEIVKKYKDNIVTGQYLIEHPKSILSISPNLDILLGGGIPDGTVMLVSGKFKCGKSSTALQIVKQAQKIGKHVHYDDIEGRLKKRDIEGIEGLDPNNINIIKSTTGNILSAEKHLTIVDGLVREDPGSVIIMDSISQLYAEKQMTADIGEMGRSPIALMLSDFCKRLQNIVPINGNIVVMILHLIANTSGYGSPFSESGGNKVQYSSDIKLKCKTTEPWNVGSGDKQTQVGQIIRWQADTTALNAPPGRTCKSYLRYGYGIDEVAELVDTALELGIIIKAGAWFKSDLFNTPFQGQERMVDAIKQNPETQTIIYNKIKEMLL
jgi:recombination protein RecA